mmetsp:Transcript_107100/g.302770  ORF Transcript_107100/g.302770 Transcript_107100/m.302770 type:complete len:185 (-) Transcript_107100:196-750(-)
MAARVKKPLHEYSGWPQGIYPMSDGWVPPAYPGAEELVAYEDKINSYKKATLVKRHICVKDPSFKQMSDPDVLQKSEYSCMCFAIEEGPYSGEGDEKTWYMIIYYEPSKKAKVERAFKTLGCDVSEYEQVVVDPDSAMEEEVHLMYIHGAGHSSCIVNTREYSVIDGAPPDPWGPKDAEGASWQ